MLAGSNENSNDSKYYEVAQRAGNYPLEIMRALTSIVIRPRAALREMLKGTELGKSPFASESQLWTYEESDRVGWTRMEFYEGVKLLFLLHLQSQFLSKDEWKQLGSPDISTKTFDDFWETEVFHGADYEVEEVYSSMRKAGEINASENSFLKALARCK
jgi:hypothetical protein